MKFSSILFGSMSGSLNGVVASHNRFGPYLRQRSIPVNTNTSRQGTVRNNLSLLVGRWTTTLTALQRSGWQNYALNVPVGGQILTGQNMYIRCNASRLQGGFSVVDDAPAIFDSGDPDTALTLTATGSTDGLSIAFDDSLPWYNEAGGGVLIYVGLPVNATRNFFNGPWRFFSSIVGATPTPPTSPLTGTSPWAIDVGQLLNAYARVTRADGRLSPVFRFQDVVG